MLVQYSAIPRMLAGAIISALHLSDTNTQREFRAAKRIKLPLQNLPQFQKQSEVWGCWNDNALVEKHIDYRIILMLKHMVMSRKTPEQVVIADQWRPQQNARIYRTTNFSGLTLLFHIPYSLQLSFLLQSLRRNLQQHCRNPFKGFKTV